MMSEINVSVSSSCQLTSQPPPIIVTHEEEIIIYMRSAQKNKMLRRCGSEFTAINNIRNCVRNLEVRNYLKREDLLRGVH